MNETKRLTHEVTKCWKLDVEFLICFITRSGTWRTCYPYRHWRDMKAVWILWLYMETFYSQVRKIEKLRYAVCWLAEFKWFTWSRLLRDWLFLPAAL